MIVLGPMDADINGAPPYWRTGNWRPNARPTISTPCAYTTIPFDKCDIVFEYDARIRERPRPEDQAWDLKGEGEGEEFWSHDADRGALRFSIPDGYPSYWERKGNTGQMPDRAVAYGLFLPERYEDGAGRLDFVTQASPYNVNFRGMRGSWSEGWNYRRLDNGRDIPMVQPAAVRTVPDVWHRLALDAELKGPKVRGEDIEKDDGGGTIGSLDGILNNDPRRLFGYGQNGSELMAHALFGKTDGGGGVAGWIRNYCASWPGRFMRAGFRAVAIGEATVLRFVFCAEGEGEGKTAAFLVRYASPSLGLNAVTLPDKTLPAVRDFETGRIVELRVELKEPEDGEELWFTIERDWQKDEDEVRSTLHLLMVIVQEAGH